MTRDLLRSLCFLGVFYWIPQASAEATSLNLLNWEEYISDTVLEKFEAEFGIPINVIHFESDASRDEILASPAAKAFDIVVIDNYSTEVFSKSNLLLDLTALSLPNRHQIDARWQNSCGSHGIPYFWGTLGIAYRQDKVSPPPTSWADLLEPKTEYRGHIGMLSDSIDTLVPALKLSGYSMNSESEDELKTAFNLLQRQQPYVLTYQHAVSYVKANKSSQLYMALLYGGDQYALNGDEDGPWQYVIPKEGTALWVDCISILSSSDKIEQATQFVNFINRPDIAALNADEVGSASTNRGAFKLLSGDSRKNHVLYPEDATLKLSEKYQTLSPASLRIREKIMEVLAGDEDQ